jgi:hypothetical protein
MNYLLEFGAKVVCTKAPGFIQRKKEYVGTPVPGCPYGFYGLHSLTKYVIIFREN